MDATIVVAATGIIGVIVGIAGSYFIQKIILERQRKWALEDEERKIKRGLLSNRLDILEETMGIMMKEISGVVAREMGVPLYDDKDTMKEQGIRLQGIRGEAWAALGALDSQELSQCWREIVNAHSDINETGTVSSDSWNKAEKSYTELIKLTDTMRSHI